MTSNEIAFSHPELSKNEVFFTNTTAQSYANIEFKTKRVGTRAYDGKGNALVARDWFPVFLQVSELQEYNLALSDIRKQFNGNSVKQ